MRRISSKSTRRLTLSANYAIGSLLCLTSQQRLVSVSAGTPPMSSGAPPKKAVPYEEGSLNPVTKGTEESNFAQELGGPAPLPKGMSTSDVSSSGSTQEGFEVKQPSKKYFSRYADEMKKQQEYMRKIQSGEIHPSTPPPTSANFRSVVPRSTDAPAEFMEGGMVDEHENKPPLARDEDIGEIHMARRRQRRQLVEAGEDGSVRLRKPPKPIEGDEAADLAGDPANRLDARLEIRKSNRPANVTKDTAKYHAMSDEQLMSLSQKYVEEHDALNMLGTKADYSEDHKQFEDKWKHFLEYMSQRPTDPKSRETMSPKFQSLIDGHLSVHGFYNPGQVWMTTQPTSGPEDTWYADKFGSDAYAKPVSDPVVMQRSIFQNALNLNDRQKEQFKAIFSDFTTNDVNFVYHVVNSYPYAAYLNYFVCVATCCGLYYLQLHCGAFDFYDEFLGLDFRRVPEMEEPVIKVVSLFIAVMVCTLPCMLLTIAMQRSFRILSGRPVGPP